MCCSEAAPSGSLPSRNVETEEEDDESESEDECIESEQTIVAAAAATTAESAEQLDADSLLQVCL